MVKFSNLIFGVVLLVFSSTTCKSMINKLETNTLTVYDSKSCPENGSCFFEIFENKFARINTDEFGKTYLEFEDSQSNVLKFHYRRHTIDGVMDSGYDEFVYLNIDNLDEEMFLENESLTEVNAIFVRLCFCKEHVGHFPISNGVLNITKHKSDFRIDFKFSLDLIPQALKSINATYR